MIIGRIKNAHEKSVLLKFLEVITLGIERDLESTFVHRDIFMNFTIPLKRILSRFKVYQ